MDTENKPKIEFYGVQSPKELFRITSDNKIIISGNMFESFQEIDTFIAYLQAARDKIFLSSEWTLVSEKQTDG